MATREIGSEYHYEILKLNKEEVHLKFEVVDDTYTFSGRTAIENILKNLSGIHKALLPSYCCDSMVVPFRVANIEVEYYDVFWNTDFNVNCEIKNDIDLVLWCNYFGFRQNMPDFGNFIDRGGIVIEDITHSYLSGNPFHPQSQYIVASIRKWFPLMCGGYCASKIGKLQYKPNIEVPVEYIKMKMLAMKQKAMYLDNGDEKLKEQYMKNYSLSNHWLAEYYSKTKIDSDSLEYLRSIDFVSVKKRRIENASIIYRYLYEQKKIFPMFHKKDMDCPLFVPIICRTKTEREKLRQKLIAEKIYCPVHWPKPNCNCKSNIYDLELSLLCDQRYCIDDMKRMMKIICT